MNEWIEGGFNHGDGITPGMFGLGSKFSRVPKITVVQKKPQRNNNRLMRTIQYTCEVGMDAYDPWSVELKPEMTNDIIWGWPDIGMGDMIVSPDPTCDRFFAVRTIQGTLRINLSLCIYMEWFELMYEYL